MLLRNVMMEMRQEGMDADLTVLLKMILFVLEEILQIRMSVLNDLAKFLLIQLDLNELKIVGTVKSMMMKHEMMGILIAEMVAVHLALKKAIMLVTMGLKQLPIFVYFVMLDRLPMQTRQSASVNVEMERNSHQKYEKTETEKMEMDEMPAVIQSRATLVMEGLTLQKILVQFVLPLEDNLMKMAIIVYLCEEME